MLVTRRECAYGFCLYCAVKRESSKQQFIHSTHTVGGVYGVQDALRMRAVIVMTNQKNNSAVTKFNVVFGIKGYDKIPANAAVLVNERKMRIDGEFKQVTEFMAIEGVKSTKNTDILMPLLAVMLAAMRKKLGFDTEYKVVTVGNEKLTTGINKQNTYTRWLKGNCVYKSNVQGELTRALVLDKGILLRNTNLNVKAKQAIVTAHGNTLRVLMHQTCKAIVAEATMFSDIISDAKSIFENAYTPMKQTPTITNAKKTKVA